MLSLHPVTAQPAAIHKKPNKVLHQANRLLNLLLQAIDYIEQEVLTKGPRKVSPSLEIAHIQGIIEDFPISRSSLPVEEYTCYNQICADWSP